MKGACARLLHKKWATFGVCYTVVVFVVEVPRVPVTGGEWVYDIRSSTTLGFTSATRTVDPGIGL